LRYRPPFAYPEDDLTAKIVNKLFLTFQGMYPTFKQAWPTETEINQAKLEWIKALVQTGHNNIDDVKRGVAALRLTNSAFVPSVGQFLDLCKKVNKPAYHQDYVRLTNTCTTREMATKSIKEIMDKLKVQNLPKDESEQ